MKIAIVALLILGWLAALALGYALGYRDGARFSERRFKQWMKFKAWTRKTSARRACDKLCQKS